MVYLFFRRKIFFAVFLLLFILLFGVFGYHYFSNYKWVEALYMTVITISTVGFQEVKPTDDITKIFTITLIILSVFTFTYSISILTQYFMNSRTPEILNKKRMNKKIKKLSNHTIICGYGRNGRQAAKKFLLRKKDFVVIEKNLDLIKNKDILFVDGDASDDNILKEAGIERAKYLISALPNDTDNLFIVLSARQLNNNLIIVSRISNESSKSKLDMAGADHTVMPDKIGGDHMSLLLTHPGLTKFLESITSSVDTHMNIEELSVEELPKEFEDKNLIELNIRQRTGCNIIGYKTPQGRYIINPEGDTIFERNSKLVILGKHEQIQKINALFNIKK